LTDAKHPTLNLQLETKNYHQEQHMNLSNHTRKLLTDAQTN